MKRFLHQRGRKALAALGAAALLSGAGAIFLAGNPAVPTWAASKPTPTEAVASANDLSTAFRHASEQVLPSVVTIRAVTEEKAAAGGEQQIPDDLSPLFKQFFGDQMPKFEQRSPHSNRQEGTGSGVIIDKSGLILTNNHVAGGGAKVMVKLHDGREFPATEVKTDPKTDLAIVRIEGAGDLPAAALGNSDQMEIGDWVLAIGSPFGLNETVTAGIISAKSRGMGIAEREDFLQTDAAINPGNSGGPLVDLNGQVVGINTAISTRGGGSDGIGFAVPINLARWVSGQLVEKGSVERAFLGIGIQQVSSDLSKQFGLHAVQGALVTEVRPGTAAANAGLKVGDVVTAFDGRSVNDPRQLQNVVEQASLKQIHHVSINRDGKEMILDVTLQAMPQTVAAEGAVPAEAAPKQEFDHLGIEVSNLSGDVAKQLGMTGTDGVVITAVQSDSPAESLGLKEGMVIARVGTHDVKSVDDFRAAVKDADLNTGLLLLVKTQEGSQFVVLKKE